MSDDILKEVRAMRAEAAQSRVDVCGHLHTIEAEQRWLRTAYGDLTDKVQVLSESHNGSIRARQQLSDADLSQQAKLAEEIITRQALEKRVELIDVKQDTQLAILFDLKALAKNPYVKLILTALGTAILTWLSAKGIK